MTYCEKEKLREDISFLKLIEDYYNTKRPDLTHQQKLKALEKTKKRIRQELKDIYEREEQKEIVIGADECGESWIIKEWYDSHFTEEDKKDYIESNWRRINCAWDCTGLSFTRWISIFNVDTSFGKQAVVYHAIGLDV